MYIEEFSDNADIVSRYGGSSEEDLNGAIVHLAWYGYGDYCGSSLVIYEKDGKLYEVNASHCSCYGLEDQWEPEETSWAALATREIEEYYDGSREANEVLRNVVGSHL